MSDKVIICTGCGAPKVISDGTRLNEVSTPCKVCYGTAFFEPEDARKDNISEANNTFLDNIIRIFGPELVVSRLPDEVVVKQVRTEIAPDMTISRELRLDTINELLKGL
jgi:hypothetical protein